MSTKKKQLKPKLPAHIRAHNRRVRLHENLGNALDSWLKSEKKQQEFLPVTPEGITLMSAAITLLALLEVQ